MRRHNKVIRIFVSSTFEDMKEERNYLQQNAFHRLREYCRDRQWQFQAVDLRWGISEEATIDQKTMEICLREIERCQEQSPRPNFIVLLGERYGWRPLPDKILQSVADLMKPEMTPTLAQLFKEWYDLDENQLPEPIWRLKARQGRFWDYKTFEKDVQIPLASFFTEWSALHLPDPNLPENKDNPLALQRLKMERSATEQEIHAGAFRVEDAAAHVFAYVRKLPEEAYSCPAFHDADQNPINKLQNNLRAHLPESNILPRIPNPVGWDKSTQKPTEEHLAELDCEVEVFLKKVIDAEMKLYQQTDEDTLEEEAHADFATKRTFCFAGREQDIEAICNYALSDSNALYVLWGESGTGKSALLAKAAGVLKDKHPKLNVITRFIGVTGKASTGFGLLTNICRDICKSYSGDLKEIPEDPVKLEYSFYQYLAMASQDKPLVIFLDALDQFSQYDSFRQLHWLPRNLPPNVKVILSTLPGDCLINLQQRKEPAPVFREITQLNEDDGRLALTGCLKSTKRKLQSGQIEQVIRHFVAAECSPLYLHLAFDQARQWTSDNNTAMLADTVAGIITQLYKELAQPQSHGDLLVEKVLTLLRCAKQGLSDDEILGVLATDEEYWQHLVAGSRHSLDLPGDEESENRWIPPIVWIRLYHDLEFYLTRRNAHGGEVITFYHRQLAEAVDRLYLQDDKVRQEKHRELANFFAGKVWLIKETAPLIANIRKCDELPWQRIQSEDWDAVVETLCNLDFFQAKSVAKLTFDMVDDFNSALKLIPENAENVRREKEHLERIQKYTQDMIAYGKGKIKELDIPANVPLWTENIIAAEVERQKTNPTRLDKLKAFYNFLGQEADNLQNYATDFPIFAYQQAWNWAADGPVGEKAGQLTLEQRQRLLLRVPYTRPEGNSQPQVLKNLLGHTSSVTSVALSLDGKRVVSGSGDKTLKVWNLQSGNCLQTLEGHAKEVTSVALSPDGSRAVSGSDDKMLKVWDLESGKCLRTLEGHTDWVTSVALSLDGKRAVSGSGDKTLKVWDLENGDCLQTLEGHTDWVKSVALSPDGSRAVSGSADKTIKVWDLQSGSCLRTLEGHTDWVNSVALSPDGSRAVSRSRDKTLKVWDLQSGICLQTLKGHTDMANSVALSPDGRRGVSGSGDKTLKVWDMQSCKCLAQFTASDSITAVGVFYRGIFGGGSSGKIFILHAGRELLCPGRGIVTARNIWDFNCKESLPLSVNCPFCGHRFSPDSVVVDTINSITEKAALKPEDSARLNLPKEAWDDPGLLSNCSNCGEKLKFNPFIPVLVIPEESNELENQDIESTANNSPITLRTLALEQYTLGDYETANETLEELLTTGFEIVSTHIHLVRVCILLDQLETAISHLEFAWQHRKEAENYVLARILWFKIVFASLQEKPINGYLCTLKSLLNKTDVFMQWTMEPILEYLKPKLSAERYKLASVLVDVLSRKVKAYLLNDFPEWRDAITNEID